MTTKKKYQPVSEEQRQAIRKMLADGVAVLKIAEVQGVGRATVYAEKKKIEAEESPPAPKRQYVDLLSRPWV